MNSNGIDMKLRFSFLLPALAIVVALALTSGFFPHLIPVATGLMPVVVMASLVGMMLMERKRRHRNRDG